MSSNLAFFNLVFASFLCQSFGQFDYGTAKVGEQCERDFHCIKNAFCRDQRTCFCEPNYLPVPDSSICVPTIGLICDTNEVCELMSNAECRQNVCACKDTFTVNIRNSSDCVARPVAEHDQCQRNDECIETLDRALCINDRCACLTDHHFVLGTGKCVRNVGIFGTCTTDYQCYMPDMGDEAGLLACRDGTCKCTDGNKSKHCSGASTNSATMIAAGFFLFLVKFFA